MSPLEPSSSVHEVIGTAVAPTGCYTVPSPIDAPRGAKLICDAPTATPREALSSDPSADKRDVPCEGRANVPHKKWACR